MSVIEVTGLTKSYGDFIAVGGIDLTIEAGEIFALLGPNGAGKTTTVEILAGFRDRDRGKVNVLGFDPAQKGSAGRIWRNRIGIVLQSASDAGSFKVRELVAHFSAFYAHSRDIDQVIAAVGLSEKANSLVLELSGGQRRRLDVALGIIGNPELLFLDEPTTGFDPEARRAFWSLIRELKAAGTTILLTTHYLDEAEALADRVAVINSGQIIEVSTPSQLGGRQSAKARVQWLGANGIMSKESDNPTAFIADLAVQFNGEIPELIVSRPSLEDIYLKMIGAVHE
jgi:ABC-2 type transport system ATP-binding protein